MSCSPSPLSSSSEPVLVPDQSTSPPDTLPAEQSSDHAPPVQNDGFVPPANTANTTSNGATHNAQAHGTSWGNSGSGWGSGIGWETKLTDSAWMDNSRWVEGIKITSLSRKEGAWGDDDMRFVWRSSTGSSTDSHVTHHTRSDLGKTLSPAGPTKLSPLDDVPSDKWARVQLVKSLREAQQNHIPGPNFSLSEVTHRLRDVQAELSVLHSRISHYDDEIDQIRATEDKLNEELRELNQKVFAFRSKSCEVDTAVKRLVEVERDLKDLESIALTYLD
ncbi:hypothetical protein AAF712_014371 [Marasmius tenuissimus]|uniref:Uncharacterized protein n=1 Tax=Marasmius tenuissimus TaxID=585030 RepID=A0ABR2ZC87_9AGAR